MPGHSYGLTNDVQPDQLLRMSYYTWQKRPRWKPSEAFRGAHRRALMECLGSNSLGQAMFLVCHQLGGRHSLLISLFPFIFEGFSFSETQRAGILEHRSQKQRGLCILYG